MSCRGKRLASLVPPFSVVLLQAALLAACLDFSATQPPAPPSPTLTASATPTFTPKPSATATPTWIPLPTWTPTPTVTPTITPTFTPGPTPTPTPYRDPLEVAPPLDLGSILPWDETQPVTLLLMGLDRRPTQSGRSRTDTMLLLRLNPATHSAGVLSIPRDLYVDVPGRGKNRINSAYVYGGGELAKQTVTNNLGVEVDYYLAIDFVAVTTLIDEIGGIDIDVPYAINDPTYPNHFYGYDPLYIPAGPQHMDGTMALKYARTRHGSNDFDRAARQQQVMFAVRDQVLDLNKLPFLLTRAPGLYQILTSSYETDLTFDQIVSLAWTVKDIPRENINNAVIDQHYVTPYTTSSGSQVLLPYSQRIKTLVNETLP